MAIGRGGSSRRRPNPRWVAYVLGYRVDDQCDADAVYGKAVIQDKLGPLICAVRFWLFLTADGSARRRVTSRRELSHRLTWGREVRCPGGCGVRCLEKNTDLPCSPSRAQSTSLQQLCRRVASIKTKARPRSVRMTQCLNEKTESRKADKN